MAETQLVGEFQAGLPEALASGEPVAFSLAKGIGNSTIREHLSAFRSQGMESPQASRALLTLFAPTEASGEHQTLWDEIGKAYTDSRLSQREKDNLVATNYFLLDTLANGEPQISYKGNIRAFSKETASLAQDVFDRYSYLAAEKLDPENPKTVKALKLTGAVARTSVVASLLAACAGTPAVVGPVVENPPAAVATISQEENQVQPTATSEVVPPAPTATPGLFPDYQPTYDPSMQMWVAKSPDGIVAASWSQQERQWSYDYETIARDERISIFDARTFPDKFRLTAENWLEASDEDWREYQEFVEASRAAFFEEQGITDEVAGLTEINPNLRSLWGIIYWAQHNRDRVVAEQIMPVVTPMEIRIMMEQEARFETWLDEEVNSPFGFNTIGASNSGRFNSQEMGEILGRRDIHVGYNPYVSAVGNEALVARIFPDDPNSAVVILHLKTPPDGGFSYRHVLLAASVNFSSDFTLPAGTYCFAAKAGEKALPKVMPVDMPLGPLINYTGDPNPVSTEQLFGNMGALMTLYEYPNRPNLPDGQYATYGCIGGPAQMEMAGRLQDLTKDDSAPNLPLGTWPWP